MKKLAKHQQVYRPIYADILAGFSLIETDFLQSGKLKTFYIKHLKETDYGNLESLVLDFETEAKKRGILTDAEQIQGFIEHGAWSNEEESKLFFLKKEVGALTAQISSAMVKSQRKPFESTLKEKKKELADLQVMRNELLTVTLEGYVEKKKHEEILRLSFYEDQEFKNLSFSEEDYGELTHTEYTDLVNAFNVKMSFFSDNHIGKLALLPFFINSMFLCKKNPFLFFGKPVVDLTVHQIELFSKGMFYQSVLEQGHVPPDEFYDDLDKLISWYEIKSKSKATPQNPNLANNNINRVSDAAAQGYSALGATKEELQDIAKSEGHGSVDLAEEAEKLKKATGKETLDIYDMAKLHGL